MQLFQSCVFEKMRCVVPGLQERNPGMQLANAFSVNPAAKIDTDANGVISEAEQRAYAEQVIRDL
jgi:hypothetical protein